MKRLLLIFTILFIVGFLSVDIDATETDLYKIGIDDVINITVLDHDELSTLATVSSDGSINMPYIGVVPVVDMTVTEIEKQITERLMKGFIKFPVVSVYLVKTLSKVVYSYGEVQRKGKWPFDQHMTVLKAMSIFGGANESGRYGKLRVRRKNEEKPGKYKDIVIEDLNNGLIQDSEVADMPLKPEDVLIVERNKTFLIQGEVASRGRFELEKDMTVLRAILQAGGINENGRYGKLKLRRKQENESGQYKDIVEAELNDGFINNSKVEDLLLKPEDILIVERNKTFLIQGAVANRGRFLLEKNMTVLRAILQAGGIMENGRYGKLRVRRKQETESGEYKDIAEAELKDGVINSSEVEDILLEPEDILIVEQNRTYFIYGEVNRTGEFILMSDMTVFKAITIAGGFTKWGSGNRVKILRPSNHEAKFEIIKVDIGNVIDGDATADINIKPGDTVIVSSGIF